MEGTPHSPKTNGDHLIKDNLGRYCPKTFEKAKGKKERWCHRELKPGPFHDLLIVSYPSLPPKVGAQGSGYETKPMCHYK